MHKLEVTEAELKYRASIHDELRAQKQRELSCSSCGNVLSHKSQEIFSHPIFEILQCRKCNKSTRDFLKSEDFSGCQICTAVSQSSYKCSRRSCPCKVCQACLRRNAVNSLAEAGSAQWKCLACNSKPLWKLRGVCAAVMSFTPKRTKKKQVSGNSDDEKTNFKNISYVKSRRINDLNQLKRRLAEICDEETSSESVELSRPLHHLKNKTTNRKQLNVHKKPEQYSGYGNILETDTSSDDCNVLEIKSISHRKRSKFQNRRESPEKIKNKTISQRDSRSWRKESRHGVPTSPRKMVNPITYASSDDSDFEGSKKIITSTKRNSKDEPSGKRRKISEATVNGYKLGKSKEEMKRKTISFETSEQDEEEDENSMELRNPVKIVRRTSRQSSSTKATRGDTKLRKLSNEKEKVDRKLNKSQHHRRLMKNNSVPSDSSSGREFHKSKLFPSSYVALKRIDELEKDYTKTPEASPETPKDTLTKDQTFALKNSVTNFFKDLKKAANQLVNDIEVVERQYCKKNSMRSTDVDDLILKTKNVVTNYKQCVDTGENKIEDYYDKWCKKANIKNVLRAKKTRNEVDRPLSSREESPKKSSRSRNDSSAESSPAREKSRSSSPVTPTQSTNFAVISDCNSEEIFSGDSIRNSSKKHNSSSLSEGSDGAISREPSVEKASIIADVSSDEILESSTPRKLSKKSMNKSSSSADLSDHSIDMDDKKKANELNGNPKMLNSSRTSARSINLSDSDIFEDDDNSIDKEKTEEQKGNQSIEGTSDIEEKSTPVKASNPEKSQTKIDSLRSSIDSQRAAKSTNPSKSPKIQQDSNTVREECEEISTKGQHDSEKNAEDDEHSDNESISSRETLLVDSNDQLENRSKSLADNDDIEAVDSTLGIGEDTEAILQRTRSASPADIPGVETSASRDDDNDKTLENADLKSPNKNTTEEMSPEEKSEKKKSRSSSPIAETPKKRSSEKEMREKCIDENNGEEKSNSPRNNNSRKRSSEDSDENDTMESDKPLKSRSNSLRLSMSSTPSEGDDLEARNKLLLSSNSEESSGAEDSFVLRHSSNLENESDPQTLPESDSNISKTIDKDKSEVQSETTEKKQPLKMKRTKFRMENHPHFMKDERLRQGCVVSLNRLKQKVLDRYSKALEKSRDYVDSKKLKRLVDLDNLDKEKAASKSSNSEDDDTPHKDLKNKKKAKAAKEREETLLDHLEKVKNGNNLDQSIEYGTDASDIEQDNKNKPGERSDDNNLFAEAEKMAKKRLLESSDSEKEEPSVGESSDKKDEGKKTTKKTKGAAQKDKSDKLSNDDEKREDKADKSRWRKNKLLTLRISDSDSNDEKRKSELSEEKSASKAKKGGSESDDSEEERSLKKKRIRRRVLHSDSDGEPSPPSESESSDESDEDPKKKKGGSDDEAKKKRKRKKKGDSDSSSSDSLEEKRPKTRRKRIKTADSDSDSDLENSQGSPSKAGRKNIRKLIRDKQVADVTKQAAKDEEERLQRIAERQKLYNQMYENRLASETKVDKLVLDFNEETKETLVSVDEGLVKKLKPHQAQGIKFMWDACFESLERIKTTKGSGCILAHCMGLGKSFQVVALSHTLLQHEETGIKTIMVVCPLSTVLNWANEFKIWLENLPDGDDIEVYELTKLKQNSERKFQLQRWQKTGGVMIIGYEMFRNLSNTGKKVRKNMQDAFLHCLVDPGPDLIVCDEGHLLKNEDTALSKAMRRVKTLRRIVLTGTPLQNNLIEYHCMVQFVKPNLLGTKKEFTNRFENPITNGQFDDSTEYDVRLMKKRAHVLHKMLEGSVQRLDYSVLTPFLPPKQEYVIFVKLTEVQVKMYRHYLDNYARRAGGVGGSLFADFQALQRIWTHPLVVRLSQRQKNLANEKKRMDSDSEGSLRDFINDGSDSDTSSSDSDIQSVSNSDEDVDKKRKRGTRANPVKEEEPVATNLEKNEEPHNDEWWEQFIKEGDCEDMRVSCKLLILFAILKQSHAIGDKVLVFSQSLYSLTLIEEFLRMIDDATHAGHDDLENLDKNSGSWSLGLDYFRLDGQTSADNRRRWCDIFNRPSNTRARLFLISTRAGGLGINLTAANRVIIFDASWNPSHDVQSIFRIYRFGQKKPCYVYRLLAAGTMEEKIYNRQVTKLSLSCRVVDEQQIERHYSNNALAELYELEISEDEKTLNLPKDRLLADILLQYKHCVFNYHEHDSLLENQAGEELDEEERQQAWLEYEEEKKGRRILPPTPFVNYQNELFMQQTNLILAQQNAALTNPAMMLDYENIRKMMSKDYPGVSEAQQKAMATRTVYEMYNYVERQAMANQLPRVNQIPLASQLPLANQMPLAMINMGTGALHFDNRQAPQPAPVAAHPTPEMIRMYQQSLNQQNGQINFPNNKNITAGDSSAHAQNSSAALMPPSQLPSQSTTLPAVVDDDIIEIPASPEKILGTPPVPGGSRKSQEE